MCLLKTKIPKELKTPFSGEALSVLLWNVTPVVTRCCFVIPQCYLLLLGCHTMPLLTRRFITSFTDLRYFFFTIGHFLSYTLSCFFLSWHPWASSSASKSAELHAVVRNTVPAQMSVWITAIHRLKVSKMFLYLNMSNIINYLWWKV